MSTSIPPSPTPGKDPPPSSTEAPNPPTSPKPHDPTLETDPASAASKQMPPPPRPKKPQPRITTQATSTSNILLHPSLSRTATQSNLMPHLENEVPLPRPEFAPFFTLINDTSAGSAGGKGGERGEGEGIHPRRIHYIFSDDDASDLLTNSLIHSLNPVVSTSASRDLSSSNNIPHSSTSSSSSATFKKDPARASKARKEKAKPDLRNEGGKGAREERVIIVDIDENGTGVKSASCLSKEWQVLSASLSSAPTFDASSPPSTSNPEPERERGLMLRIEGVGVDSLHFGFDGEDGNGLGVGGSRDEREGELGEEEMAGLLEGFDKKMGVLRRIIEARASKEDLGGGENEGESAVPGVVGDDAGGVGDRERDAEEKEVGEG